MTSPAPYNASRVATATRPRFVDTSNPALAIDCPSCALVTARFMPFCRNCGYQLWPNGRVASAAFRAWRDADLERSRARRFDLAIPLEDGPVVVDYLARAHELGIHVFPSSNWPFVICVGFLFLGLAAVPFPGVARIVLGVIGAVTLLAGIFGWVILEDVRIYHESAGGPHGGAHGAEHETTGTAP